mmetsp:Transcript_25613/g.84329  ORF Transcript_25613/g.84329 Transcript_25613/m.84329 type:complete len:246 (-) Transcript_25613:1099-1836(-)
MTGSSGWSPRKMYMRVFSIIANSSGLSSAHFMSHASLRSNARCSPAPTSTPLPRSRSKKVRIPLMSMMLMRVELQLRAITCGRHRRTCACSMSKCGSAYRSTTPLSRPTMRYEFEAQMAQIGSDVATFFAISLSLTVSWMVLSSMWKKCSRPSVRAIPFSDAADVSFETAVRYCQTYTCDSDATMTWVDVIATYSGSISRYLESTGDPMALQRIKMYCPSSSARVVSTQYSPQALMLSRRLTYLA